MSSCITVMDKQQFLKKFLHKFEMKQRESTWLLKYLQKNYQLMEYVHFVEGAQFAPKSIMISTSEVGDVPFLFQKLHFITNDAEKAFHEIRLNPTEHIYIELHFPGARKYPPYLAILEDNPYLPEKEELGYLYKETTEQLLWASLDEFSRAKLLEEIDRALDHGDEELFTELVKKLQQKDDN